MALPRRAERGLGPRLGGIICLALIAGMALAQSGGGEAGAAGGAGVEVESTFAGLTIVAFGDQEVDIFTGVTTLPDGGQIVDRQNGLTLTAASLSYRERDFVSAQEVVIEGEFGSARAASVRIDLTQGRLEAEGGVEFESEGLGMQVPALTFDSAEGIVRFASPVVGAGAEFESAGALLDTQSGVFLLLAPYRYQDELFELRSDREGSFLALSPGDDGSLVASSRVAPEVLARLTPYLAGSPEDPGQEQQ